jgi:kinesin family protein 18/19
MTGSESDPGVMVLMLQRLMQAIDDRRTDYTTEVALSYLEVCGCRRDVRFLPMPTLAQVYNEVIRDLLGPSDEPLDLREDPIRGVAVAGITQYSATTAAEVCLFCFVRLFVMCVADGLW